MSYQLSILNLVYRFLQLKKKVVFVAMKAEYHGNGELLILMSTSSPMKLKFDMARDILTNVFQNLRLVYISCKYFKFEKYSIFHLFRGSYF